jgi:hypothetical protein
MKPSYNGFEAKKSSGFITLPPAGAYVAEIQNVRFAPANKAENRSRDAIELMMEITEGEYAGRYMEFFNDQKEKFGDTVKYKGVFRLIPPLDNDDDWRKRTFEGNIWCIQESNPGYVWDWDEKKLKGKKVGISVRDRFYTFNGNDRSTTEIARLETLDDVKNGKVKTMKPRDQRTGESASIGESNNAEGFTVASVDVPW